MGNCHSVGKSKRARTDSSSSLVTISSEVKRLDLQHIYFNNLWTLFSSPMRRKLELGGCKILDIGCGTGTWLIELATAYPDNEYFGVDIAPLHPQENVPDNVEFINADVLEGLPFKKNTFDFVHQRLMVRNYNMKQWEMIIDEIARVTRLTGYIELIEMDLLPQNKGPATGMLYDGFLAMMHAKGIGPTIGASLSRILRTNNDLIRVAVDSRSCLLGEWGGLYCLENGINMIKRSKKSCLEFMSVSPDEFDNLIDTCILEVEDYQTYITTHRFCAVRSNFF